jgi:hypothetical protein
MSYSRIADVLYLLLRRVSAIDCKTLIKVRDESCNYRPLPYYFFGLSGVFGKPIYFRDHFEHRQPS